MTAKVHHAVERRREHPHDSLSERLLRRRRVRPRRDRVLEHLKARAEGHEPFVAKARAQLGQL